MPEIDALIASINRKQKEEVLIRGSALRHVTYQRCTTGSLAFDLMLGGGWPLNCWNEVIGLESSGKTAMCLKTIAAAQALNPEHETLWVAAEDLNEEWAQELGVDLERVTFVMTNVMEQVYDAVLEVLEERAVDAVIIDSYPALVPSEEDDKNMMELTVGRGAYMTNKFMRKSMSAQRRSITEDDRPCLGIIINQWRDRIGVLFGDPRTTPGGKGKNYSYLTRVEVTRDEWIQTGAKTKVGQTIKARTIKNKTAAPQRTALVDFYFEEHLQHPKGSYDTLKEVWTVALVADMIEQKSAWYHFGDHHWHGEKAALEALRKDPLLVRDMVDQVRYHILKEPVPNRERRRTIKR